MRELLSSDNPPFSEPTARPVQMPAFAIDCTESIGDDAAFFVSRSIAESTRRAYRTDLQHFAAWGGSIPSSPAMVADYIAAHAEVLSPATLVRRIAALSNAHEALGVRNPTRSKTVRAVLRGVKRERGSAQRQAQPLLRDDLFLMLDCMSSSLKDVRDRALLLLGFAAGFRRSELVGLDRGDLAADRAGRIVTLRYSKTDQDGVGRRIGIPYGRTRHCPVAAIEGWLALSRIEAGPLFRPLDRHGNMFRSRLSADAVSQIIKERVAAIGLDPAGFSGHSLRSGFATSAAQLGVSTLKIRAQTGHTSDAMLARYVRDGELFRGNAAGALL